jgi:hypothetical protein
MGGPAEIILQIADDLAVHVINGGGEKQQGTDHPTKVAEGGFARLGRNHGMHFYRKPAASSSVEIQLYKPA